MIPGMESLIGQGPQKALDLLGKPGLDRSEGMSRQLQFANQSCILDIYYYPRVSVGMIATYAEAREPNGRPMEAGRCLSRLVPAHH